MPNKFILKKKATKSDNLISLTLTSNDFTEDNPYTKYHVRFTLHCAYNNSAFQVDDIIKFNNAQEIDEFKNNLLNNFEPILKILKEKFIKTLDSKK